MAAGLSISFRADGRFRVAEPFKTADDGRLFCFDVDNLGTQFIIHVTPKDAKHFLAEVRKMLEGAERLVQETEESGEPDLAQTAEG